MTSPSLIRRLGQLEAGRPSSALVLSPAEREKAAERYAASLDEPEEVSEAQRAYFASRTLHQIAADYDQILRGGPAPWAGR
ncbi:hypothetical protein SAMN02799631_05907 [Methylobacterium sp. 174MFSha1.1]|uniref:hypothetical protein n=1 Tax=Methylobacterium sp. 174MFSha1.1 TaxID=1502749 RepID=UPI0008E06645|nr:hypothetical protein [Methylobacterium sp. 174MFSha1.1]SFV14568.1 hypothetical protein SAMN02799631_05907 [Methylobacterium sp. 174MFSha1.1]